MSIFGVPFEALDADRLAAFLNEAGDEPLLWEAKGTDVRASEVRRQVCGFANSHEGGYMILGAERNADAWALDGVPFPDEPQAWISNVIGDLERGVRPRPDFQIVAWEAPRGHVAVIRVAPISTPPCITNGTVYERLPGKTQTVSDPQLLASLFARGDQARMQAEAIADRAASLLLADWLPPGGAEFVPPQLAVAAAEVAEEEDQTERQEKERTDFVRFAVAVSATGNAPNIESRLFQREFATGVWTDLRELPSNLPTWLAELLPRSIGHKTH